MGEIRVIGVIGWCFLEKFNITVTLFRRCSKHIYKSFFYGKYFIEHPRTSSVSGKPISKIWEACVSSTLSISSKSKLTFFVGYKKLQDELSCLVESAKVIKENMEKLGGNATIKRIYSTDNFAGISE